MSDDMRQPHELDENVPTETVPAIPAHAGQPAPSPLDALIHDRLGAYLNTMVAELGIEGKGQYLRDLFGKFEEEVKAALDHSPNTVNLTEFDKTLYGVDAEETLKEADTGEVKRLRERDLAEARLEGAMEVWRGPGNQVNAIIKRLQAEYELFASAAPQEGSKP